MRSWTSRALGERTVTLDCDVLQADGGTRTASITGAYVALADAMDALVRRRAIAASPLHGQVAAVSVGIVGGVPVLDLDYAEDSSAETDMNVVMNNGGAFIEIQGTAEGHAFRRARARSRCSTSPADACEQLFAAQLAALQAPLEATPPGAEAVTRTAAFPARLVLATGNAGKLREMRAILAPWHVEVLPLSDFTTAAADETGHTFVENAILKARFAAQAAGLPAIADDSGLEVDALDGAPGHPLRALRRRGRRRRGEQRASCCANSRQVRRRRRGPRATAARWSTCAAPIDPAPLVCAGELGRAHRPRAARQRRLRLRPAVRRRRHDAHGGGVRARREKNRVSHRGQALRALVAALGGVGES